MADEVKHIVQEDEEMKVTTTPPIVPRKIWGRAKSLMSLAVPPRNHDSAQSAEGGLPQLPRSPSTTRDSPQEMDSYVESVDEALVADPRKPTSTLWAKVRALRVLLSLREPQKSVTESTVEKQNCILSSSLEDETRQDSPRYMWEEPGESSSNPAPDQLAVNDPNPDPDMSTEDSSHIIHPNNTVKACWDLFVGMAVLYVAISLPVRLAFDVEAAGFAQVFDILLDGVFILVRPNVLLSLELCCMFNL